MSQEHAFDRIAREKLAERYFPFQEGDWQDMERLITARRRRPRAGWWFTLAAAGMLASLAWWLTRGDAVSEQAPAGSGATAAIPANDHHIPHTPPVHVEQAAADVSPLPPTSAHADATDAQADAPSTKPSGSTDAARPHATDRPGAGTSNTGEERRPAHPGRAAVIGAAQQDALNTTAPLSGQAMPGSAERAPGMDGGHVAGAQATGRDLPVHDTPTRTAPDAPAPGTPAGDAANDMATQGTTPSPPASVADSTKAGTRDSTAAASPPPTQLRPANPWMAELSGLGGLWWSAPRYAGTGTEQWRSDVQGRPAPGFGAELAFRRSWLGFGAGVQAVQYVEQLQQDRIERASTAVDTAYGLVPTEASVTIIIDTIQQGSITYYVTQTIDTTLNIVTTTYDTTTTVAVERAGIDRVNRSSYVEVPLFLDLRTSMGRWTLGARGGPFIGFRTMQRTQLPSADGINADLADGTFRSTVFGWTARVYARYRLTDRLSVGLEPGLRGSFGDVMDAQVIRRRNTSWGAWLSLSYRLP